MLRPFIAALLEPHLEPTSALCHEENVLNYKTKKPIRELQIEILNMQFLTKIVNCQKGNWMIAEMQDEEPEKS